MTLSFAVDGGQARVVARLATHMIANDFGAGSINSRMAVNCHPTNAAATRFVVGCPVLSETASEQTEGFDVWEWEYAHPEMHQPSIAQTEPVLSGGVPAVWDGDHCSELGFHYYPFSNPQYPVGYAGGSLTTSGVYQLQYVFEWRDSRGIRHQSAPSPIYEITLTGAENAIQSYVSTLTLTEHQDADDEEWSVKIVGYRTVAGGSIFYRENEMWVSNVLSDAWVSYSSTCADADLLDREVLYTDGGVAPNFQPPAFRHVIQHDRRLWGISRDDPTLIWISKTLGSGAEMPGFALQQIIRHEDGGANVALASLGTQLLALKERGVYLYSGSPPDDLNQGSTLAGPIPVALQTGCVTPTSVIACPNGVAFLGPDSFWLVDRGLQVARIGGPVEDLVEDYRYCVGAALDSQNEIIVWCMTDGDAPWGDNPQSGVVIAWHYLINEWMVWHVPASDSSNWTEPCLSAAMCWRAGMQRPTLHLAQANGRVVYLDSGGNDHDGSDPVMRIATPGLQFDGLGGYQRVSATQIRGTRLGAHTLLAMLVTDFGDPFVVKRSLAFDGVDDALLATIATLDLDYTADSLTVSAWVKTTTAGTLAIVGKRQHGGAGWWLYLEDGRVTLELRGATTVSFARAPAAAAVTDGEWHHVAGRWTADGTGAATNITLWVDGVQVTPMRYSTLTQPVTNANNVSVGALDTVDFPFAGAVTHVVVCASALTDSEVEDTLYYRGRPGDASGLSPVVDLRCGDGDTYPTITNHGSGADFTMYNMAVNDIRVDVPSGPDVKCMTATTDPEVHMQLTPYRQKGKALQAIVEAQAISVPIDAPSVRLETFIARIGRKQGLYPTAPGSRG